MEKDEVPEKEIEMKCKICPEEYHNGHLKAFCQCVSRNIALAKQFRKIGMSWRI